MSLRSVLRSEISVRPLISRVNRGFQFRQSSGLSITPVSQPLDAVSGSPPFFLPVLPSARPLTLLEGRVGDLEGAITSRLHIRGRGPAGGVGDEAGDAALLTAGHAAGVQHNIGRRVDKYTWRRAAETVRHPGGQRRKQSYTLAGHRRKQSVLWGHWWKYSQTALKYSYLCRMCKKALNSMP